jgi:Protein tyrosine/serine phosphatase
MVQVTSCNRKLVLQSTDQLSPSISHVWYGTEPDLDIHNKTELDKGEGDVILLPVSSKQRYYYVYENNGKRYLCAERTIPLHGTFNLRDLGGYPAKDGRTVKWGRFFRSDALNNIDEDGMQMLQAMGIRSIVDFRNIGERTKAPDILSPDWKYTSLDPHADTAALASAGVHDDKTKIHHLLQIASTEEGRKTLDNKKTEMIEQYKEFVSGEESRKVYQQFIRICLDEDNVPLIYHCRGGKDRTGFATLLILSMLGVSKQVINQDYMLTKENMAARNERRMNEYRKYTADPFVLDYLHGLMMTKEEYIASAWKEIDQKYHGIDAYLQQELGLSQSALASFLDKNLY